MQKPGTTGLIPRKKLFGNPTRAQAKISPDGRWLAFTSNVTGITEVFVRAFPGPGGPWQISSGGGSFPIWSRARQELFYSTVNQQIFVAPYRVDGDAFIKDPPRLWSETRFLIRARRRSYDLHPDGNRMVAAVAVERADAVKRDELVFVFNFFDELRRLVPGKN